VRKGLRTVIRGSGDPVAVTEPPQWDERRGCAHLGRE
jgi:hypothetical protein